MGPLETMSSTKEPSSQQIFFATYSNFFFFVGQLDTLFVNAEDSVLVMTPQECSTITPTPQKKSGASSAAHGMLKRYMETPHCAHRKPKLCLNETNRNNRCYSILRIYIRCPKFSSLENVPPDIPCRARHSNLLSRSRSGQSKPAAPFQDINSQSYQECDVLQQHGMTLTFWR
jgi:hypothetical protein